MFSLLVVILTVLLRYYRHNFRGMFKDLSTSEKQWISKYHLEASREECFQSGKDQLVLINVGGQDFSTYKSTLKRFPNTKLANLKRNEQFYNREMKKYFFDRDPRVFQSILCYYRTGKLHLPQHICGPAVEKELQFWGINEYSIEPCCWGKYAGYEDDKRILEKIATVFNLHEEIHIPVPPELSNRTMYGKFRKKVWTFLDNPFSSRSAKSWAMMMSLMVLVSVAVACFDTVAEYRVPTDKSPIDMPWFLNTTNSKINMLQNTEMNPILQILDHTLNCVFTLELIVRFIVCPDKVEFFKNVMTILEIICVLPTWLELLIVASGLERNYAIRITFDLLRFMFIFRVFRIYKLAKHYMGLKIFLLSLKASWKELMLLLVFIALGVLVFSTLIYHAEIWQPDTFDNVFVGFWWAIVTMTTVGYGDKHPTSWPGYIIGAFCALSGILATSLAIPIIANNFNTYYSYAQMKRKLVDRKPEVDCSHDRSVEHICAQSTSGLASAQSDDRSRIETVSQNDTPFCGFYLDEGDNRSSGFSSWSDPSLSNHVRETAIV